MKKIVLMIIGILSLAGIGMARENNFSRMDIVEGFIFLGEFNINPSREAKILANLINRPFWGKGLNEIFLVKSEEKEALLLYLIKTGRIVDAEGKPLEIEQAQEIFKHSPEIWEAMLLQFYYEVSKDVGKEEIDNYVLKNVSFGEFVNNLYKEGRISIETAFTAGLLGRVEAPLMKELFRELPQEQKLEMKPMVFPYGKEELENIVLQNTGDKIIQTFSGKKNSLGNYFEDSPGRRNIYLKIDLLSRGVRFLGLVISTIGIAIISPQGLISYFTDFPKGPEFTLAELLRMVVKGIKEVLPSLDIPPKPLLPPQDRQFFYFHYLIIILCFWIGIRKMQKLDWDLAYVRVQGSVKIIWSKSWRIVSQGVKPVKEICSKSQGAISQALSKVKDEKDKLKILIKVPSCRNRKISVYRSKCRWDSRELKGLEEDLDKRLKRIKYWAEYLTNIKD